MVDLSSCYFCGAAMDVSLREHPVVPEALAPTADEQETVVLCATCQRKLDRVLTPVVGVAQRHATAAANRSSDGEAGTADAADVVTQAEPERADDGDEDDGDDYPEDLEEVVPADLVQDAEADGDATESDDAGTDDTAGTDGPPFEVDDTTSVFDDRDDEADEDAGTDSIFSDGTTTISDDTESDHGASGLGDGITIDDADSAANANGGDQGDAGRTGNAGGSQNASASDDAGDSTPDVDPRTYNKVVRLLKNRDLPVARTEIEAVASSAYDIPDPECETIIDAAIQRGLVAERDGNLVHPDGV